MLLATRIHGPRLVAFTLVLCLAGLITVAAAPISPGERHSSGLQILGGVASTAAASPLTESLARAWSDALLLADANPEQVGYPWADSANGVLVFPAVNVAGEAVIRQWIQAGAQVTRLKAGQAHAVRLLRPQVPVRAPSVSRSYGQLERIKDDATHLVRAGLPDADAIFQTEPDYEHNRVIVTVDRRSDALLAALANRYGTDALAVRIGSAGQRGNPATRNYDQNPFYGGAWINTPTGTNCTSGFSWQDSSFQYMLSAGHCGPNGGSYSTPAESMGTVTAGSRENWDASVGTVYLTGQSVFRGDLSLIQIQSGKSGAFFIYTGGWDSSSSATVKEMWSRSPLLYDQFCTGGKNSGEICGWQVIGGPIDHQYSNGEWARHIYKGIRPSGTCIVGGDSGGPVYTYRADGFTIAAKGIISGQVSDPSNCYVFFSDVWDAYWGFPGTLKTG